ncbi:MAG: hypothetical protein JST40_12530 [Armatimonadetes bacterium]|nr:hypothetical protein [Armatimonadota bacterium]
MKLNLLPTYVSKGAQSRTAAIFSILFFLLSIVGAVLMMTTSSARLAAAKSQVEELTPQHNQVLTLAKSAETEAAKGAPVQRNIDLTNAMLAQNTKYTTFYRMIARYIPSYLRVNRMSVTPMTETSCQLNINGVIQSFQKYADVSLILLRIPGAMTIARDGYVLRDTYVPNLIETDQYGIPYQRGDNRRPSPNAGGPNGGPDEQLNYLMAQASQGATGFTGQGNFGVEGATQKLAMPGENDVTYTIVLQQDPTLTGDESVSYNFMTPNPTEALKPSAIGAGGAPAGGAPNTPGAPGAPGAPGGSGSPYGPGGPPPGPPPGALRGERD